MYSFTKPNPKPLFKEDTKLWIIFIIISLLSYITFTIFLEIKVYLFKKHINSYKQEITILNKKLENIKRKKNLIIKEKQFYETIIIQDNLLKQTIQNLFELIPDPITITYFKLNKNKLIIYGITPSKDIYNLLMLPPLESIFNETHTYFYLTSNGWYRFKSENYLKKKQ
jgi:hypothetical protein